MTTGRINQVTRLGRQNSIATASRERAGEACTTSAMPEGSPRGPRGAAVHSWRAVVGVTRVERAAESACRGTAWLRSEECGSRPIREALLATAQPRQGQTLSARALEKDGGVGGTARSGRRTGVALSRTLP